MGNIARYCAEVQYFCSAQAWFIALLLNSCRPLFTITHDKYHCWCLMVLIGADVQPETLFSVLALQEHRHGDAERYNEIITHETLRVAVCDALQSNAYCPDELL